MKPPGSVPKDVPFLTFSSFWLDRDVMAGTRAAALDHEPSLARRPSMAGGGLGRRRAP